MQNHLVTNQTSRLGTICKAVFPQVGAVRHEMVRPVLSDMVHSRVCYIHVLETGMWPYERNKKKRCGCLAVAACLGRATLLFTAHCIWRRGHAKAPGSYLCRSSACPHGRDFLRAHPFFCWFFFFSRKRKWWQSLLSPLSQQQAHGVPDNMWGFTLAVTFSVTAVARGMWVYMSSDTCMC